MRGNQVGTLKLPAFCKKCARLIRSKTQECFVDAIAVGRSASIAQAGTPIQTPKEQRHFSHFSHVLTQALRLLPQAAPNHTAPIFAIFVVFRVVSRQKKDSCAYQCVPSLPTYTTEESQL